LPDAPPPPLSSIVDALTPPSPVLTTPGCSLVITTSLPNPEEELPELEVVNVALPDPSTN